MSKAKGKSGTGAETCDHAHDYESHTSGFACFDERRKYGSTHYLTYSGLPSIERIIPNWYLASNFRLAWRIPSNNPVW